MSYQVLARKWRPATFAQVVGQSHVLHALTNALSQQRLHHAYLFTGTRGVGKTSLARLFAKGLNCELGVTATPCGECASCVEIAQGRFVDLIEVDAASRTKVDDTREILDNVQYRPTRGRFKVYLIDEVHMLSRSSFNALLKTLEEPPEHVKFLLATTDPQKLPVTVLSRCLQFNLKSLTQDDIAAQLANVLGQEQLEFETTALTLLAKAANGSMRDALSLTDQAIAFGAGQVMLKQVQTMLGSIDEQQVLMLLHALTTADVPTVMHTTQSVLGYGADPQEVLRSLLELLHQITLTQFAPAAAQLSLYSHQIKTLANELSPEQVQLYYQILLAGRKDLPHAPDPKSGLEMALLRAVAFVPEKTVTRWLVDSPANIVLPKQTSQQSENTAQMSPIVASTQVATGPEDVNLAKAENDNASACADEALVAEQAIILSQAQSLGHDVPQVVALDDLEATCEPTDPVMSDVSNQEVQHSSLKEGQDDQTHDEAPLATSHQSQSVDVKPSSTDETSFDERYSDQDADHHIPQDDFLEYQQFLAMGEGGSTTSQPSQEYEKKHQNEHQALPSAPTNSDTPVTKPVQADVNSSSVGSIFNDDLLDQVLASRDALLSDISREATKDGDGKKQAAESTLRSPMGSRGAKVSAIPADTTEALSSSNTALSKPEASVDNPLDRPPWEDAPLAHSSIDSATGSMVVDGVLTPSPTNTTASEARTSSSEALPTSSETQTEGRDALTPVSLPETLAVNDSDEVNTPSVSSASVEVKPTLSGLPMAALTSISGNPLDLHWYKLMAALDIGGRIRQLAVNSICQTLTEPLSLMLKPDQKHLAADVAVKQLEAALTDAFGNPCTVSVVIGSDPLRETPLEIRQRFHRELLQEAEHALLNDENIQWLSDKMEATLDLDTLAYPQERLSLRSQYIVSLDVNTASALLDIEND